MVADFFFFFPSKKQMNKKMGRCKWRNRDKRIHKCPSIYQQRTCRGQSKTPGGRSVGGQIEIPICEGGQTETAAKTRDIAGQTAADDEDEDEHDETMMGNDDDLLKRRAKERERKCLGLVVWLPRLWKGIRADFF